jgi:hypothetical protein
LHLPSHPPTLMNGDLGGHNVEFIHLVLNMKGVLVFDFLTLFLKIQDLKIVHIMLSLMLDFQYNNIFLDFLFIMHDEGIIIMQ